MKNLFKILILQLCGWQILIDGKTFDKTILTKKGVFMEGCVFDTWALFYTEEAWNKQFNTK